MITNVTQEDIQSIYNLGKEINDNFSKLYIIENIINDSNYNILIYKDDGKVIGFIMTYTLYDTTDILNIIVDKNYRRQNIGSKLIEKIIEINKNNKIMLEVNTNNEPAINLYKKLGFEIINTRKRYYHDDNAYVMSKSINNTENKKDIYILAIESSCDETSVAIVKNGCEVISLSISTQIDTHKLYGGVVPEIASRMHTEAITLVLEDALKKANMKISDMSSIAVTYAPGLMGGLLVGLEAAKTLAFCYNLPLIKVNHLIGHIYANNIENKLVFPLLALIISGGHTELLIMEGDYKFKKLGETLDDAIGESFDKVARVLNLPYPGGPCIEKLAKLGENTYQLPKSVNDNTYNFSFSGLKSAVINVVNNAKNRKEDIRPNDLACSFQTIAVEQIIRKLSLALKTTGIKNIVIAGGVSANLYLQNEVKKIAENFGTNVYIPSLIYCTDNAAMIGAAAYPLYLKREFSNYSINAQSRVEIK